jgi:hypothetical protein
MVDEFAKQTISEEGKLLKKELRRTIERQTESWEALSPVTIAAKGHALILIDSKQLMRSFRIRRRGKRRVEVGILKSMKRKEGNSMLQVALAHEHGTDSLPARPFNQPTFDREQPGIHKRAVSRFLTLGERLAKDQVI